MDDAPLSQTDTFVMSTVVPRDIVFVAMTDDAIDYASYPHAHILFSNAGQLGNLGMVEWGVVGLGLVTRPERRIVAIGTMGQVLTVGQGERVEERVGTPSDGPEARGMIRCLGVVDGVAYAAGMNRQVYRRSGAGAWITIDFEPDTSKVCGFEAIDGFGTEDLYAVGWNGEIRRFRNGLRRPVESPTNLILTGVCCAPDGNVYACGKNGAILVGTEDKWSIIDHPITKEDFWSVAWFKGAAFFSSMHFVYRLKDGNLSRMDMGPDWPQSCYHLATDGNLLVSTGKKDVMAFDGDSWRRIF